MDKESKKIAGEQPSGYEAEFPQRFGYFLTHDPVEIVDRWKLFSDRVTPEFEEQDEDLSEDSVLMCEALASELRQLASAHPYRAAEIVAEIIRRGDNSFLLHTEANVVLLYIAASRSDLAVELWAMLRQVVGDNDLDETIISMKERLEADVRSAQVGYAGSQQGPVDRVAMTLFFVEHVGPSRPTSGDPPLD